MAPDKGMRMRMTYMVLFAVFMVWGSGNLAADDTEILGAMSGRVDPNVLIIFDTSASMAVEDIPAESYRSEVGYVGAYERDVVYRWQNETNSGRWTKIADRKTLDRTCVSAGIAQELVANGQSWGRINTDPPFDCGEWHKELDLRLGNYLNYEYVSAGLPKRSRLNAAKEVVKQIIEQYPDIRFGLMQFNDGNSHSSDDTEGGRLSDHGDINDRSSVERLKADIDAFSAETYTPLAETLAEAGLYFAGQPSWFNNLTYKSPIDIECRSNFIILMTDGESTRDQDLRLYQSQGYMVHGTIGDYDGDGNETVTYALGGTDYVDDVAAYLYENDLMPMLGAGDPNYEKQNIITHTIGFKHSHRLLQETAKNGGGRYFTAGSTSGLSRAFDKIMDDVENARNVFVAPSVPVSRVNGVYAGDFLYRAMFKPEASSGLWRGNLKKYRLDSIGRILDQNSQPAVDSGGFFIDSASSFWSNGIDGQQVDAGGAGALLVHHASRKLYTCISNDEPHLPAGTVAFSIANKENIPLEVLGVDSDEQRRAVINDVHGFEKDWVMGDVLHSEPVVVHYDTNRDNQVDADDDALIFVGTNAGLMHAFWDSTGQEQWGFIPPHHLARLKRLSDGDNAHDYFVDGPPVVVTHETSGRENKILIFGDRRGGSSYTALDITDYNEPVWKYSVGEDILGDDAENLGQSWGRPQQVIIATGSASTRQVVLLPGGYDPNQDAAEPAAVDTHGRAVLSVELESGRIGPFKFYHDENNADMTHCIVDVVGVDPDGDGIANSIYAPDLNGNMFAFTDEAADGSWRKLRLFSATNGDMQRKIFYSPDVVRILGDPTPGDNETESVIGEMIYFGTGDRAHPNETKVQNRFYAIKNFWWDTEHFTTLTDHMGAAGDGDLHDATPNLIVQGTTQERENANDEIETRMGWFIDLEARGEKVVSSPVVYNRTVYFTTFVPHATHNSDIEDPCDANNGGMGEARLYGVDYKDGRAVHDHWSNVIENDPETGDEIASGGKADRFVVIGNSIPSAPMIAIRDGVAMLYVGVAGKLFAISPLNAPEMKMYYWREIKP